MKNGTRLWIVTLVLWVCTAARADVNVGDTPKLEISSLSHGTVRLSDLKGKLVLVDFWATWCGPCMDEAPHMVQINQKYAPKGLRIVGISLDDAPAPVQRVIKEKSFTWPQFVDVNGRIAQQWGVNGIPHVFLIGPAGDVIWEGHPAQLDKPLESAFIKNPPVLVDPKILADAKATVERATSALSAGSPAEAMKLLADVPPAALKDETLAKSVTQLQQKLSAAADAMLAEVDPLIADKKYDQAATKLRALSTGLAGFPAGAKAKQKLSELMSKPEARQQIQEAERIEKANQALAAAQKLQADKQDEPAYARFKSITKEFAGTAAATTAAEAVAAYESDPAFMEKLAGKQSQADANKARSALSLAESYRRSGKIELAKKKYQEIIEQFPGSKEAETAKVELAKLK
jgi:thiol-disulfide isomerase/thioredoxin